MMTLGRTVSALVIISVSLYALLSLGTITSAPDYDLSTARNDDIPNFGLGTWLSEKKKVSRAVEYALKLGYHHIDAALVYGNEKQVGKGIAASGVDRRDIWVTSKLWNTDHRPDRVRKAAETSISNLGVDYLDLYLIHWPVAFAPDKKHDVLDNDTIIIDTWLAMEDLVRANLTRHIGISNFAPRDLEIILGVASIPPYAHEFEAHPYLQQQSFVDFHLMRGVKVIAYSPLANTNPTYDSNIPGILDDPFWKDMAERKHATVAQAVLAWGQQRGTIVIPKSVHKKYIKQNFGCQGIQYTESELAEIAKQDKKLRMNDPGKKWGLELFKGLDDPTKVAFDSDEL